MKRFRAIGRRNALKLVACALLWMFFSALLYAVAVEPYSIEVTRQSISLAGGGAVKLRLALISDLHASSEHSAGFLKSVVGEINRINPDYTIIAGDLVDDKASQIAYLSPLLQLDPSRTIIILGNHDYGPEWDNYTMADGIAGWLRGKGFTVLRNGNIAFSKGGADFCLIGADSLWAKRTDLNTAFAGTDDGCVRVLAVHEPDSALGLGGLDADLILAGHTHGGQVCLPFIGAPRSPVSTDAGCMRGWYSADGIPMFVTKGVGQSLWLRFNARPEIAVIEVS